MTPRAMANRIGRALRRNEPKAVEAVLGVIKRHQGRAPAIAEELGITKVAVYSWLRVLESNGHEFPRAPKGRKQHDPPTPKQE